MINWKPLKAILRRNSATSFAYKKLVRIYYLTRRRFPRSYKNWIALSENLTQYVIQKTHRPILILLDAGGKNESELITLIQSIKDQDYPFWQLSIYYSQDSNRQSSLKNILLEDSRIALYRKDHYELGHEVFDDELETKPWLMMLTGDFLLSPYCLTELILSTNSESLMYSDHDELSWTKQRKNPNFKPDWNPDLFYSQDYIENCCIYNADLIAKLGFSKLNFSRDFFYHLTLEIARINKHSTIKHVPKVLFHKVKALPKLNAELAERALKQTLENKKIIVKNNPHDGLLIHWPIPKTQPLVSLIIPTRNGYDILKQAVDSIVEKTTYQNYEIIIIDNQTDCQRTLDYLSSLNEQYTTIRILLYDFPFNYSAMNNFAVQHANGQILGFINNDIQVISPNWLTEMVSHVLRTEIGCVGAKLYYPNDTIQHAGVIVGMWGCAGHSHKHAKGRSSGYYDRLTHVQNYSAVTAACLLIRKQVFEQVDGFEEQNLTIQFNDVDLCLKVKSLNLYNLWTPHAELYHHESVSRGLEIKPEQIARSNREVKYMHNTWNTRNYNDPAYNINLSFTCEDFSITRRNEL
jgi:GT2 family glycosyltransferase